MDPAANHGKNHRWVVLCNYSSKTDAKANGCKIDGGVASSSTNRCQGPAIAAVGTEVGMGHVQERRLLLCVARGDITKDRP